MKRKCLALCLSLLLVFQLCGTAFAAEEDEDPSPSTQSTEAPETNTLAPDADAPDETDGTDESPDADAPDEAESPDSPAEPPAPADEPAASPEADDTEYTVYYDPDPEESGMIQSGAISGPQTIPGEVELMEESALYNKILTGLRAQSDTIIFTSSNPSENVSLPYSSAGLETLNATYSKVVNDNPELFYCTRNYSYSYNSSNIIGISPKYDSYLTSETGKKAFTDKANEALAQINGVTDPVEQLLILHDYLVKNCKYDQTCLDTNGKEVSSDKVYSAYGALVDGNAVCQGYALAYKYLVQQKGFECLYVSSEKKNHGWNLVKVNGSWYFVDVTWDDPTPNTEGRGMYKYFLKSRDSMRDHLPSSTIIPTFESASYDWNPKDICNSATSTAYETGYIFNSSSGSIYRKGSGNYFYVNAVYNNTGAITSMSLYQTSALNNAGTSLRAFSNYSSVSTYPNPMSGMLWHDDVLYYVSWDSADYTGTQYIMAVPLDSPKVIVAGTFDLTAECRNIGLRAEGDKVIATNNLQTQLGTGSLLPSFGTNDTDIVLSKDKKAILVKKSAVKDGKTLWVASYEGDGKQMKSVQRLTVPEIPVSVDYALIPLKTAMSGSTVKAFSLDAATFAPDTQPSLSSAA